MSVTHDEGHPWLQGQEKKGFARVHSCYRGRYISRLIHSCMLHKVFIFSTISWLWHDVSCQRCWAFTRPCLPPSMMWWHNMAWRWWFSLSSSGHKDHQPSSVVSIPCLMMWCIISSLPLSTLHRIEHLPSSCVHSCCMLVLIMLSANDSCTWLCHWSLLWICFQ